MKCYSVLPPLILQKLAVIKVLFWNNTFPWIKGNKCSSSMMVIHFIFQLLLGSICIKLFQLGRKRRICLMAYKIDWSKMSQQAIQAKSCEHPSDYDIVPAWRCKQQTLNTNRRLLSGLDTCIIKEKCLKTR